MTSKTVKMFGMEPVIAMISYSNFGSSKHPNATKVNEAVAYLHKNYPDMIVDGELQTDFALNTEMLQGNFSIFKISRKKSKYPNFSKFRFGKYYL